MIRWFVLEEFRPSVPTFDMMSTQGPSATLNIFFTQSHYFIDIEPFSRI